MIKEFKAVFDLFKYGKAVANKRQWKQVQVWGNNIAAFLGAALTIACGFDMCYDLSPQTLQDLGGWIATGYGLWNTIMTVVTSEHVGVRAGNK